ncbi:MAG: gas vesicle protein K [Pseudomonadota bacterium]
MDELGLDVFALPQDALTDAVQKAAGALSDEEGRLTLDPASVERDLAKLVLVMVELLRRLMEHQALARMDRGTLTDAQIDALSDALFKAQSKIDSLREAFGIAAEDFNIDLGPLGTVL